MDSDTVFAKLFFLVAGIFCLVIGIISLNQKFIKWNIQFTNKLKGVKTQITKESLLVAKIGAVVAILLGVLFILASFFGTASN